MHSLKQEIHHLLLLRGNEIRSFVAQNPNVIEQIQQRTSFLPASAKITERAVCIATDITKRVTCKWCKDNYVKWSPTNRTYATYCCVKCRSSDPEHLAKTRKTNLAIYGDEFPTRTQQIRDKIENTNLLKYGVKSALSCDDVRGKAKQTNMERYGVPNVLSHKDVQDKAKRTMVEKYGVEHCLQSDTGKRKFRDTSNKLYGVDNPAKSQQIKDKVKQANKDKYGVPNFSQQHLSSDTLRKLNDSEWLHHQHITQRKPLIVIADDLDCSDRTVGNYLHAHGITTQHTFHSTGEQEVADYVVSLGVSINHNDRTVIPPLELDVFIPEYSLAIEYCGVYWHSEQNGKGRTYHKTKFDRCKQQGIQLLTIFEDEWKASQTIVKRKIASLLHKTNEKTIFARKTTIATIPKRKSQSFFDGYHIQGSGPGSVCYGLMHENELVACMSFSRNGPSYYLTRYATKYSVPGGFSKLLKYFTDNNEWVDIVSFADQRWSDGKLYYTTGWQLDAVLPADYSYSADGITRTHKFNYRRKKLPTLLQHFDPLLSEWENCKANNILRIWDCGKKRFVYSK